jgi:hypothetical protein
VESSVELSPKCTFEAWIVRVPPTTDELEPKFRSPDKSIINVHPGLPHERETFDNSSSVPCPTITELFKRVIDLLSTHTVSIDPTPCKSVSQPRDWFFTWGQQLGSYEGREGPQSGNLFGSCTAPSATTPEDVVELASVQLTNDNSNSLQYMTETVCTK